MYSIKVLTMNDSKGLSVERRKSKGGTNARHVKTGLSVKLEGDRREGGQREAEVRSRDAVDVVVDATRCNVVDAIDEGGKNRRRDGRVEDLRYVGCRANAQPIS